MAEAGIESRLTELAEQVKALAEVNSQLRAKVSTVEARHMIENMVNRYEYLLPHGHYEEIVQMFAQKTPGVTVELMTTGVFEGIEGVRRCYYEVHKTMQGDPKIGLHPGILSVSTNTTPVIEIADDGLTAKGLWINPSVGTVPVDGDIQAFWMWTKRAFDFVKEDGEWKFWHYHVYNIFFCPFGEDFTKLDNQNFVLDISDEGTADDRKLNRPTTYHWTYSKDRPIEYVPQAPEPYRTFAETFSY